MINYPIKPWLDGQSFTYVVDDDIVVGTYSESKNAWVFTRVGSIAGNRDPIFSNDAPTVYPGVTDEPLVPGDIWYDTSGTTSVVKHVWDGDEWLPVTDPSGFQTTLTLPTVNEEGGLRAFAQQKLDEKNVSFDVPSISNQYDANHALVEMIAAVSAPPPGDNLDYDLFATRIWVQENYAPLIHVHGEYATTEYVDAAVGDITIPSLDGYATESWVTQNYAPSGHNHSQYITSNQLNTKLDDYATSQELEVASNHIELKSNDGIPFFKSETGSNSARSNLKYYGDTSESNNIVTRLTVQNMLGDYATKAEIPDTSSFITVADVQNYVTNSDVQNYVESIQLTISHLRSLK